jgi:telomerase reverse transcriptase
MTFNIPGVVLQIPNPHVIALKTSPWTDVLSLLGGDGEDIMSKLLIDCGVFSCVDEEKAAYRQISGMLFVHDCFESMAEIFTMNRYPFI